MSDVTAAKKPRGTDDVPVPPTLRKSLKNRHIQLIALGGAIGTGLFYGSSESIQLAGPSILLADLVGGLAIFMIVRALSEMAVEDPKAGAFSYYATRYWSRRAGFISGWNYWFNYVLVAMVELLARFGGGVPPAVAPHSVRAAGPAGTAGATGPGSSRPGTAEPPRRGPAGKSCEATQELQHPQGGAGCGRWAGGRWCKARRAGHGAGRAPAVRA